MSLHHHHQRITLPGARINEAELAHHSTEQEGILATPTCVRPHQPTYHPNGSASERQAVYFQPSSQHSMPVTEHPPSPQHPGRKSPSSTNSNEE